MGVSPISFLIESMAVGGILATSICFSLASSSSASFLLQPTNPAAATARHRTPMSVMSLYMRFSFWTLHRKWRRLEGRLRLACQRGGCPLAVQQTVQGREHEQRQDA